MSRIAMVIYAPESYGCRDPFMGWFVPFPPVGSIGEVLSGPDEDADYEVLFDEHPCPTLDGPQWYAHKSMLIFLDDEGFTFRESLEPLETNND